jgi:hypothetical protein
VSQVFQGSAGFLNGLSDLWLRFFKDRDILEGLLRGGELLVGQAYLDLVANVLNVSIRETPLFNKELFRLVTVREDQLTYSLENDVWVFELPDNIKDFKYLYNKIFSPTVILEKKIHFDTNTTGENDELRFYSDPFDWQDSDAPIPGVALRVVDVELDDGTSVAKRELAFWVPDVLVDHYNLYLTYGYLMNRFEPSSESYRQLLRGLMHYYTMGPTIGRIASILNSIVGLPVVYSEGEILQDVTNSAGNNTVRTNRGTYVFAEALPLRADILDEANWTTLTFSAFEALSTVFVVKDWITDPAWWYGITIPVALMPGASENRRRVLPFLYDNLINNPGGLVCLGDPGFFIGADDDGFIPTSGRVPKRHAFSFIVFERFLRHNVFAVVPDTTVFTQALLPFPRTERDLVQVIIAGSSAYTFLYISPEMSFTDTAIVTSGVGDGGTGVCLQVSAEIENLVTSSTGSELQVTPRSWYIGDYYRYDSDVLVIDNPTEVVGKRAGTPYEDDTDNRWVILGGADPTHLNHRLADDDSEANKITVSSSGVPYGLLRTTLADGRFCANDVGRWLWLEEKEAYYEISAVTDSQVAYIAYTGATFTGTFQWSLWNNNGGHQGAGIVDWPVEVRVIAGGGGGGGGIGGDA